MLMGSDICDRSPATALSSLPEDPGDSTQTQCSALCGAFSSGSAVGWLWSRLCFESRTVQVCVAFLLQVCIAFLMELTELAQPVEISCLRCNTH